MRQGEQFGLQWSWIDFDHKLITIPNSKGGTPIFIDLIDEAVEILRSFDSWQFSKWVFPHPRDPQRHVVAPSFYQYIFRPRLERSGLKVGRPDGIVWHTLRHTFGTRLGLSGATDTEFLAIGRWKSTEMIRAILMSIGNTSGPGWRSCRNFDPIRPSTRPRANQMHQLTLRNKRNNDLKFTYAQSYMISL